MKKMLILVLMIVFTGLLLAACKKETKNPDDVVSWLKNLKGYTAEITIEIKNDKQITSYSGKQLYNKEYGYRLELGEDRIFVYKEDKIYVKDVKQGVQYFTAKDFDGLFKLSFLPEYTKLLYTNEKIKITYEEIEGKEYALVELIIPGGNRNTEKAVLYVDNEKRIPVKLLIYNSNKKVSAQIQYEKFLLDEKIAKDQFELN